MKLALPLILLALAISLAFPPSPAFAQLEITESDPPDGAELNEPPRLIQLCFSEPITGDFRFGFRQPDGYLPGLSIIFQSGSPCVDVVPLYSDSSLAGQYVMDWRVASETGDDEASGTLRFRVSASVPATTSSPEAGETPSPTTDEDRTPEPGETAAPAGGGQDTAAADGGGGPDILLTALITIGSAGGAAFVATMAYLLRRRIGFDLHRPPDGAEEGAEEH